MNRNIRWLLVVTFLNLAVMTSCASSDTGQPGTTLSTASETSIPAASAVESSFLPQDDGFALAISFGSDNNGSLDDCGCPTHPEGGMRWRVGYSNAFAEQSPGVPMIHVDAGFFFSDFHDSEGKLFSIAETKNDWIVRGYSQLGFAVGNLSYHDLYYAETLFARSVYEKRKANTPFLRRLVTANVVAASGLVTPPPFIIHHVKGERIPGGGDFRVGFVGLTESPEDEASASSAFDITDPLVAVKKVIPKVRPRCDLLVILAYLPPERAQALAQAASEADLIIIANNLRELKEAEHFGQTTVAYSHYQTRKMGEALIYLNDQGKLRDIRTRMISLDSAIPADAAAQTLIEDARFEIEQAEKQFFQQTREFSTPSQSQPIAPQLTP